MPKMILLTVVVLEKEVGNACMSGLWSLHKKAIRRKCGGRSPRSALLHHWNFYCAWSSRVLLRLIWRCVTASH